MTRGRRKRQGSVHKRIKVTDGLKEILDVERKNKERFNDTIYRIMMQKGQLAKENSDLKGVIDDQKRIIEDLQSKLKLQEVKVKIRR